MEYTIQELAHLSGVTTRALRWYDKIGLLRPSGRTDGGYRLYGPMEVDRLQNILYYRALGVELAQIREFLDDPSFDCIAVLRDHLSNQEAERNREQRLIEWGGGRTRAKERNEIMSDEKKFEAFKRGVLEDYAKTYETESRAKYGDTEVDEMLVRVQGVTREQYQEWEELGQEILEKLSAAVSAGDNPAGEVGKEIVDLHRRWLTVMGDRYDLQRHRGLAELYVQDERFTAYYDRERPGCARFLRDAVIHWVT